MSHITYIKSRKNQALSVSSGGNDLRDRIVSELDAAVPEELDEEGEDRPQLLDEPILLDEREAAVHDVDVSLLARAVPSSSIRSTDDFEERTSAIRDRRDASSSPARTRSQLKAANIEDIRQQRTQLLRSSQNREGILSAVLQQQQQQFLIQQELILKRQQDLDETR